MHACTHCPRSFGSAKALGQHVQAKHPLAHLAPPYEGASGAWVRPAGFSGRKSFGLFTCPSCRSGWSSAHAQPAMRQACMACSYRKPRVRDRWAPPEFMWQNMGSHAAGRAASGAHRCDLGER